MRSAFSTREQKIEWLLGHAKLWDHWDEDVWKHLSEWKMVVDLMKRAGLFSQTTYIRDAKLPALIQEARKLQKEAETIGLQNLRR